MSELRKRSFALTGYVQRSTCNCGCMSNCTFWQDHGFGGSSALAGLHAGIERYLDELCGSRKVAKGEKPIDGQPVDVKVLITIAELGPHEHRIVSRNSFSGLGMEDNAALKADILKAEEPADAVPLSGKEEHRTEAELDAAVKRMHRELPVIYLQDIHDRMLLAQRTKDLSLLDHLTSELQRIIDTDD